MLKHYRFINDSMSCDELDSKTSKVISFKEINVIEESEEKARTKAYRSKIDINGMLSSDWKLTNVFELGTGYN